MANGKMSWQIKTAVVCAKLELFCCTVYHLILIAYKKTQSCKMLQELEIPTSSDQNTVSEPQWVCERASLNVYGCDHDHGPSYCSV